MVRARDGRTKDCSVSPELVVHTDASDRRDQLMGTEDPRRTDRSNRKEHRNAEHADPAASKPVTILCAGYVSADLCRG